MFTVVTFIHPAAVSVARLPSRVRKSLYESHDARLSLLFKYIIVWLNDPVTAVFTRVLPVSASAALKFMASPFETAIILTFHATFPVAVGLYPILTRGTLPG